VILFSPPFGETIGEAYGKTAAPQASYHSCPLLLTNARILRRNINDCPPTPCGEWNPPSFAADAVALYGGCPDAE
jgi:hypothetical protein